MSAPNTTTPLAAPVLQATTQVRGVTGPTLFRCDITRPGLNEVLATTYGSTREECKARAVRVAMALRETTS